MKEYRVRSPMGRWSAWIETPHGMHMGSEWIEAGAAEEREVTKEVVIKVKDARVNVETRSGLSSPSYHFRDAFDMGSAPDTTRIELTGSVHDLQLPALVERGKLGDYDIEVTVKLTEKWKPGHYQLAGWPSSPAVWYDEKPKDGRAYERVTVTGAQ